MLFTVIVSANADILLSNPEDSETIVHGGGGVRGGVSVLYDSDLQELRERALVGAEVSHCCLYIISSTHYLLVNSHLPFYIAL